MIDSLATQPAQTAAEHAAQQAQQDGTTKSPSARTGSNGAALMRVTLGVIILATWWGNIEPAFTGEGTSLYSAEGLRGFFGWLGQSADEGGNGGTLGFVHSFLGDVIGPIAGPFGAVQAVVEFFLGAALVFGVATRAAALGALGFFVSLFLAYFGGHEWIWTYVLLSAGALAVLIDNGGRKFSIDSLIVAKQGEPRFPIL